MQAYCLKCRSQRQIQDVKQVILKNGRSAQRGTCPACGKTVFKMGSS